MQDNPPDPQYNFILQGQNQPAKKLGLPSFKGRPPASGLVFLAAGLLLVILLSILLFSGGSPKNQTVIDAVARAQEVQRVSTLVAQQSNDRSTTDLAATVVASEASQEQQLAKYLASHGTKIEPAKLTTYKDAAAAGNVQSAVQNGNIASFYINYLKLNLGNCQSALSAAYNKTTGNQLKTLLNNAYLSNQVILKSPGF